MRKKVVLDVDGVILNFGKAYVKVAREILKKEIYPNMNEYELKHFLQINESENKIVWDEFNNRNTWNCIEPFDGVVKSIKKMNEMPIDIFIVSSIDKMHTDSRLKNLNNIGLFPKEIFCVGDGNAHKHEVINLINPHAFVDDRLDHLSRSKNVQHLAWVDNNQKQNVEVFDGIIKITSLNEWVESYLPTINVSNKNRMK